MKLYGISEDDISEVVKSPELVDKEGAKTVAIKKMGKRFSNYPLKVVYIEKDDEMFVITTYPLKKRLWR